MAENWLWAGLGQGHWADFFQNCIFEVIFASVCLQFSKIHMRIAGGVRTELYSTLPRPLLSKSGFQGCIASFETNGELEDPIKHALVPSPLVEEGCEGNHISNEKTQNKLYTTGSNFMKILGLILVRFYQFWSVWV